MTIPPDHFTFISGSVAQVVHARNAHGQYTRPRTTPTDTPSLRKTRYRTRWATIAALWSNTLTLAQRTLWNEYGRVKVIQREDGRRLQLSGQQWCQRINQSRQTPALGTILVPPTTLSAPTWTVPTVNTFAGIGTLTIAFDNTESWANDLGGALIVFAGNDAPVTHNFFAGPWRRAAIIRGNPAPPPISPRIVTDPWLPTASFNRWFRAYVILGDGRVATPRRKHFQ